MDLLNKDLLQYIEEHTTQEPGILQKLNRETYANVLKPIMLSGHVQGRLLSMLSHMIQPARILEIGTYTGYSAICLAEGLKDGGKLITIDCNEELESMVKTFFTHAKMDDRIVFEIGNAMDIIPELKDVFDLVFIDADKSNYVNYYNLCFDKVKPGGYIVADNVLWKGRVINNNESSKDLRAIRDFNKIVQEDERVENLILPVRDGLMIVRKK